MAASNQRQLLLDDGRHSADHRKHITAQSRRRIQEGHLPRLRNAKRPISNPGLCEFNGTISMIASVKWSSLHVHYFTTWLSVHALALCFKGAASHTRWLSPSSPQNIVPAWCIWKQKLTLWMTVCEGSWANVNQTGGFYPAWGWPTGLALPASCIPTPGTCQLHSPRQSQWAVNFSFYELPGPTTCESYRSAECQQGIIYPRAFIPNDVCKHYWKLRTSVYLFFEAMVAITRRNATRRTD